MVTLLALALGSVLAGLAHSIAVLIVARAIQGIGGAVLPLSFGIIRDEFPGAKVAGGVGIVAAMAAVGGGAGIVLAGPIVKHLNYHWLFWIPLIITLVAAVCAQLLRARVAGADPGPDQLAGGPPAFGVAGGPPGRRERGTDVGWGSARVLGLIALAVVLCVTWVMVELRSRQPLIDMHMMRLPAVWTNNLVAFLFGIGMYSVIGFLPQFLQSPDVHRLRVRGQHHPVRAVPAAPDRDHVRLRAAVGPDRRGRRLQGRRHHRLGLLHRVLSPVGLRPPRPVGDLPGLHPARRRAWASPSRPCPTSSSRRCPTPRPGWPAG